MMRIAPLRTRSTAQPGEAFVTRSRTERTCDHCGWSIPKGDYHWSWRQTPWMNPNGVWWTGRAHAICHTVYHASDWPNWDDEYLADPADFETELLAFVETAQRGEVTWRT